MYIAEGILRRGAEKAGERTYSAIYQGGGGDGQCLSIEEILSMVLTYDIL